MLYLVRHGEDSDFEVSAERPLSDKGKKQALLIGRKLRGVTFDCVYVSEYKRAVETFELMKGCLSFNKYVISFDYRELYGGIVGNPKRLMPSEIKDKYERESLNKKVVDDKKRLKKFWNELLDYKYDSNALLVGHGNFFRALVAKALGINTKRAWGFMIDNASLSKIGVSKTRGCGLFLLNETNHLG